MSLKRVKSVEYGSIAYDCDIQPGDIIDKIDDKEIKDFLDFKYLTASDYYVVTVIKKDGEIEEIEVYNDEYEEFGTEFESQLMDEPKRCHNNCIFCFMDQLPPNMRSTMYFKDDDVRLSFLQGNYVTLTNLKNEDIERIAKLRISPINVSVHATDPDVRRMMLNNKFAGEVLDIMRTFADNNIIMNAQIVLCKGINDGKILEKTISDLESLYPSIRSVSIVPVGISRHREGLYQLEEFTKEDAASVIELVTPYQNSFKQKHGTSLVYMSDEFYIKAGYDIPPYEHYEEFPQIENGVGMVALFMREFYDFLDYDNIGTNSHIKKKTLVTSHIMYDILKKMISDLEKKTGKLPVDIKKITNNFFGEKITVTGLICGSDIIEQLKGKDLGEVIILCDTMIKDGTELFLDDVTISDVERELGVKVLLSKNDGEDLIKCLMM